MMKSKVLFIAVGVMLAFAGIATAASVDIVQYPTGYFVDTDANKYDSPYYRWNGDDWDWTHGAIAGTIASATLNISAFDVDYDGIPSWGYVGERDAIYAYDGATETFLGYLAGGNDIWSYTTFTLGSNFFDDINTGLQVFMVIDELDEGWAVTLTKSALSIDGGTIPNPNPGSTVPEPGTMMLLGSGLVGLAGWGRKKLKFRK